MIHCDNAEYENYISAVGAVLNIFDSTTEVELEFSNKLDADAGGYCSGDLEQIDIEIATHVQGEALSVETIQRNIAHEMIHAQQIITGRLEDLGLQLLQSGDAQTLVKVSIWDGETYTNTKYEDQPWEIDAYAREEEVMLEALQYV
jgi:hypothetical protein